MKIRRLFLEVFECRTITYDEHADIRRKLADLRDLIDDEIDTLFFGNTAQTQKDLLVISDTEFFPEPVDLFFFKIRRIKRRYVDAGRNDIDRLGNSVLAKCVLDFFRRDDKPRRRIAEYLAVPSYLLRRDDLRHFAAQNIVRIIFEHRVIGVHNRKMKCHGRRKTHKAHGKFRLRVDDIDLQSL